MLASWCYLCTPILSSQPLKVTICGRHVMASVQDIQIAEALLTLCLAYYVMKWVWHCWNWGIMAFTHRDVGCAFQKYILHIFRNGWMDCRDTIYAVLCLYCCATDRTWLSTKRTGLWVLQKLIVMACVAWPIFRNGWMDCRDAFQTVLCLYCCVMDKK